MTMSRRLLVSVGLLAIIVASSVATQSSSTAPDADYAYELERQLNEKNPAWVEMRHYFGIDYYRGSQWVPALNESALQEAGLVPLNLRPDDKFDQWQSVIHRYTNKVLPMCYWNRNTDVAVLLVPEQNGTLWVYRELFFDSSKGKNGEWQLVTEKVVDNPGARGINYHLEAEYDAPEQGELTLNAQVTDDFGEPLTRVRSRFIVKGLVHPQRGESTTVAAGTDDAASPLTVVWNSEWASQMPDQVPMRVILTNLVTGEYLYDEILVKVR